MTYSATYSFTDINYKNIRFESRQSKFAQYCDFLNALDDNVSLQIHIYNKPLSRTNIDLRIETPPWASADLRTAIREYNNLITDRATQSESYIQEKYITITITETAYEIARRRFEQLDLNTISLLKDLGCVVNRLTKVQRLELLRELYRPEDTSSLEHWDPLQTGESDKDMIAPYETELLPGGFIRLGSQVVQPYFVTEFPDEISDEVIYNLTSLDETIFLTMNAHPQNVVGTLKKMDKRLRGLDREAASSKARQRKAGDYDPEIPRELRAAMENTEDMYNSLKTRNEKMFKGNILLLLRGDTEEDVLIAYEKVRTRVLKAGCALRDLRFASEELLNSILPLGRDDASQFVQRSFLTTEFSGFIPFNVVELINPGGLYYGINQLSRNFLIVDRRKLVNAHGLYLGSSGSGKSTGAKLEIWEVFFRTKDTIIIIDLEGEFVSETKLLGGQVIDIRADGADQINPLDINLQYSGKENESPIPMKTEFVMSLLETAGAFRTEDAPIAKSIISRVCKMIYNPYLQNPIEENIPTLTDFYNVLKEQPEPEARHMTIALELYVTGSLDLFAGETSVDLNNRLICFNVEHLGEQMRVFGMTVIQDFIWNLLTKNRDKNCATWLYNDEIHHSLRRESTAEWLFKSWKRGRKYGLVATGMTQEETDLTLTQQSRTLISNSEFIMLYRHQEQDIPALLEMIDLSDEQTSDLLRCDPGTGLFKAGNAILQFNNKLPENTLLYKTMSTSVGESHEQAG